MNQNNAWSCHFLGVKFQSAVVDAFGAMIIRSDSALEVITLKLDEVSEGENMRYVEIVCSFPMANV